MDKNTWFWFLFTIQTVIFIFAGVRLVMAIIARQRTRGLTEGLIPISIILQAISTLMGAYVSSDLIIAMHEAWGSPDFHTISTILTYSRTPIYLLSAIGTYMVALYADRKYSSHMRIWFIALEVLRLISSRVAGRFAAGASNPALLTTLPELFSLAFSVILLLVLIRNRSKETLFGLLYVFFFAEIISVTALRGIALTVAAGMMPEIVYYLIGLAFSLISPVYAFYVMHATLKAETQV